MKQYVAVVILILCVGAGFQMSASSSKTNAFKHASVAPNRLWIPVTSPYRINTTEQEFKQVLAKIKARHDRFFTEAGNRLRIDSDWIDGTANAFADRDGNTFIIEVFGGLARHPLITKDAFTLLVCHEMGHHLGGAPTGRDLGWPSYEGQSDYFSTLKCLRRIFIDEDNIIALRGQSLDPVLMQKCKTAFNNRLEQAICVRSGLAGLSVAQFLYSFDKRGPAPSFAQKDPTQVEKTQTAHAPAQCRLDTYVAGALCRADLSRNPDPHQHDVGVCTEQTDVNGARPRCWYKPVAAAFYGRPF